jgi:hypothetical protein
MSKKNFFIILSVNILFILFVFFMIHLKTSGDKKSDNLEVPVCDKTMYSCKNDDDCKKCKESAEQGVEMSCVEVSNQTGKICSRTNATKSPCNINMGGVNVWTAWDGVERMEWDCKCMQPTFAAGTNDSGKTVCNLNPDICKNGTFTWNTKFNKPPSESFCFCNPGYSLYVNGNKPLCIPNDSLTSYLYTSTLKYAQYDNKNCPNMCSGNGFCGRDPRGCICKPGCKGDDCSDCIVPANEVYFYDLGGSSETRYKITKQTMNQKAIELDAVVANRQQLIYAQSKGFDCCSIGWCYDDNRKAATCIVINTVWDDSSCANIGIIDVNPSPEMAGVFLFGIRPDLPKLLATTIVPCIADFSKTQKSMFDKK